MTRVWIPSLFVLSALGMLACGGASEAGNSRHLKSITIAQTVSGEQVQLVATGTFSAPPVTVTPLAVDWASGFLSPPATTMSYSLSAQPFVFKCTASGVYAQVTALAPSSQSAPSSGTIAWSNLTMGHAAINCP